MARPVCVLVVLIAEESEESELLEVEGDKPFSLGPRPFSMVETEAVAFVEVKSSAAGKVRPELRVDWKGCQAPCSAELGEGETGAELPAFSRSAKRHA
jgi:hypothetical protein